MINLALYLYLNLSLYYDVYRFVAAFSLCYGDYVSVGKQSVCSDTNCCDFMEGHPHPNRLGRRNGYEPHDLEKKKIFQSKWKVIT